MSHANIRSAFYGPTLRNVGTFPLISAVVFSNVSPLTTSLPQYLPQPEANPSGIDHELPAGRLGDNGSYG